MGHAIFMTDLQNGRQTHITDDLLLKTTDHVCRVLRARQAWSHNYADDIFQEVYIALYKARNTFDPDKSEWMQYAYQTAKFTVQNFFRDSPLIGVEWVRGHGAQYTDPYEHLYSETTVQSTPLAWELEKYNMQEKKVLILSIAGYSRREIASYLNITERTILRVIENLRIKSSPSSFLHHMALRNRRQAA